MRVEAEAAAREPRGRGQAIPLRYQEGLRVAVRPISLSQPSLLFLAKFASDAGLLSARPRSSIMLRTLFLSILRFGESYFHLITSVDSSN